MTKEMAHFLVEASKNAGNTAELREDYSGRGMYGNTTYGVVVDSPSQLLSDVIQYVNEQIGEDEWGNKTWDGGEIPEVENFSIDNMGRRIILY